MLETYIVRTTTTFYPEPTEPIMESIFRQYERVLVESLITSFGLDFLVRDQYGGDVDTIHNVRKIGLDEEMTYKNPQNQQAYETRGTYDSVTYHKDARYIEKNREIHAQKKEGTLVDGYTGEKFEINGKSDLDHIISAKEIHDDPERVLAGLQGTSLANCESNLLATNPHTNRTKKADSMDTFLEKHGNEYTEAQKQNMRQKDAAARKSYKTKIATTYYTSPKFAKDLTFAAGNAGVRMGARQALGFVFAEMWFAVKEEFQKTAGNFDLCEFLKALGCGIKIGFERAKEKYKALFERFLSGAIAGALSSLTTTLCNIFFTTAKNVVRMIRQSYASLVEAGKVLFINPDNYTFGDRLRAVVKILATGASVVAGVAVSEALGKTPVGTLPIVGDALQTFCGAFVTGILSCTLLYFFDRSELMQKLCKTLDGLHTIETEINYYRQQADYFERYAAKLMHIDLEQFQREITMYTHITQMLEEATTEEKLNNALLKAMKDAKNVIPWGSSKSFDEHMKTKKPMVFQ